MSENLRYNKKPAPLYARRGRKPTPVLRRDLIYSEIHDSTSRCAVRTNILKPDEKGLGRSTCGGGRVFQFKLRGLDYV
jgi:hypothetical protein